VEPGFPSFPFFPSHPLGHDEPGVSPEEKRRAPSFFLFFFSLGKREAIGRLFLFFFSFPSDAFFPLLLSAGERMKEKGESDFVSFFFLCRFFFFLPLFVFKTLEQIARPRRRRVVRISSSPPSSQIQQIDKLFGPIRTFSPLFPFFPCLVFSRKKR